MEKKSLTKGLFMVGAIQTIIMAVYHFAIPFQFNWGKYLSEKSPTVNWSLYALNNYFSFNLLVLGVFLLWFLTCKKDHTKIIKVLGLMLVIFWVFSFGYQIIAPMPLPNHLDWIGLDWYCLE